MENKEVIELLEGASSKIKSIVPKSPAGASLKNQSAEKIDKAISLLKQLQAENNRFKKCYSIIEECSPPDWPRQKFVEHLFNLWLKEAQLKEKTE